VSGKKAKREAKRAKEAARAAARRKQRQQTIFTAIVIAIIVAIGGVVIFVSLEEESGADLADELASETPSDSPSAGPTEDPLADVVACEPEPAPDNAGEEKPTFDEPPAAELEEGVDYRAVFETSCGRMVVDLYEDRAPKTVANFIGLVEQGFYDGLEIFRHAKPIYALQTGSGNNDAAWDIGYTFEDELDAAEEEGYTAGSVAMANSGPDTNGSQFFFTYAESPLPKSFTKFGQVIDGLDVLLSIGAIPTEDPDNPTNEVPSKPTYIESITIETGPGAAATEGGASEPAATESTATEPAAAGAP